MPPRVNAVISDQIDSMRNIDLKKLTYHPEIRRIVRPTAGEEHICFGYEQAHLVLETSTEDKRIPAS